MYTYIIIITKCMDKYEQQTIAIKNAIQSKY